MAKSAKSRYMILGLLAEGPRSGYDIKVEVEAAAGHFWRESFGSIYPLLERLRREGLVVLREAESGGRRRRLFGLTPRGRAELRRWLAEPPEPDLLRLELLLKLHVGGGAPPALMISHLERYRREQQAYLARLAELGREMGAGTRAEPGRTYRRLTLRLGEAASAARIRWATESIATLRRLSGRSPAASGG